MNQKDLLDEVLSALYQVRNELHDNVRDSSTQELDSAIRLLEEAKRDCTRKIPSEEILRLLSKCLENLPLVVRLIELLSG